MDSKEKKSGMEGKKEGTKMFFAFQFFTCKMLLKGQKDFGKKIFFFFFFASSGHFMEKFCHPSQEEMRLPIGESKPKAQGGGILGP